MKTKLNARLAIRQGNVLFEASVALVRKANFVSRNKSALCRITSLTFSFVLIPTLSLDYVRHSNADMFVLRIIIVLAWSLYGPPLYVFLRKREKNF